MAVDNLINSHYEVPVIRRVHKVFGSSGQFFLSIFIATVLTNTVGSCRLCLCSSWFCFLSPPQPHTRRWAWAGMWSCRSRQGCWCLLRIKCLICMLASLGHHHQSGIWSVLFHWTSSFTITALYSFYDQFCTPITHWRLEFHGFSQLQVMDWLWDKVGCLDGTVGDSTEGAGCIRSKTPAIATVTTGLNATTDSGFCAVISSIWQESSSVECDHDLLCGTFSFDTVSPRI
jgi:hypothetical protein